MKFTGMSINKKDLLITSSNIRQNSGYLAVVNWCGKIKYQQYFTNGGVKNLKNFKLNDDNYYSYQLDSGNNSKLEHIYTGNMPSRLIITDSKFNIIKDNIKLLPFGSIKQSTGCDYHDYKIIDLDHYYLLGHIAVKANNIPGVDKELWAANCIIQEQKDGKVIWQFETIDYPKLYSLSLFRNHYLNDYYDEWVCDYAHLNSFQITSDNKYIYLSYRNIGVVVVEKETKKIVSKLCYKANEKIKLFGQHDIRLLNDHKFSVFNNNAFFKKENIKDKKSQIAIISLDDKFNLLDTEYIDLPEKAACSFGGAILIDEKTNTWDITYSPYSTFTQIQEYNVNNKQTNLKITIPSILDWSYCYRIERAEKNYEE